MSCRNARGFWTCTLLWWLAHASGVFGATTAELIGLIHVRDALPELTGAGVQVAQPEGDGQSWQVNPAVVGQPQSLFTWIGSKGTSSTFPNEIGQESGHANQVGSLFYGRQGGVAPGVAHVDNFEASHFYDAVIVPQAGLAAKVVNQSFVFADPSPSADRTYDNYAARFGTLFVSGVGNGGGVLSPASAYNGIGVAAFGGASSVGPTADGRSKPDITAPADFTSFSTPLVAGAAALLMQAAALEHGGADTATAGGDPRTVKALLLTGSVKPSGWTNGPSTPLDARHGAGILNVFNSVRLLRGGKQGVVVSTTSAVGSAHPPPSNTNSIAVRRGWDFASASSTQTQDGVNHYFIEVGGGAPRTFTLTATLVWRRQVNRETINDLDLFLYDANTQVLLASSQSLVDNVEHILVNGLPAGRYDLQVLKNGGTAKRVTTTESYALAFEFGPPEPARFVGTVVSGGVFQARVTGEPNQRYIVQATADFGNWVRVTTNQTSAEGSFDFTDALAPDMPLRMYRAKLVP